MKKAAVKKTPPRKTTTTKNSSKPPVSKSKAETETEKEKPLLIESQKQAAGLLGITDRALREWMKEPGFPTWEAGYNIHQIQTWAEGRGRKNSSKAQRMVALEEAIKEQKLRRETLLANKLAREEEEAKGNILRRDEWETFSREQITVARDRLALIPRELCRYVPEKYHKTIQGEGEKIIQKILDELAKNFEEGQEE